MACEKCGHKLILGRVWFPDIEPDDEPYESGERVEMDRIECDIFLDVHWCPQCEIMTDIWDDNGKHLPQSLLTPNTRLI